MVVQHYCLSPHEVKCSYIKCDVFQLTTYCTSIHLVVKRYQAKWHFIYFYTSVIFSGYATVTLLPFPASHGNMKLLPKVLSHINDPKSSRLFLKIRFAFLIVSCFQRRFFRHEILLSEMGFLNASFSGGTKAQMLMRQQSCIAVSLVGREHPPCTGKVAAVQRGPGRRDVCKSRGTGLCVTNQTKGFLKNYLSEKSWFH